jgi:hypothetical protein
LTKKRGLFVVLLATALGRFIVVWSYVTFLWTTNMVAHLVADLRTWPTFFFWIQRGYVVYVDFPKEYPVGAGLLYSAIAFLMDPADIRQITWMHGLVMSVGDLLGVAVFYNLAYRTSPRWAVALSLAFSLNLTALLLSPLRFEAWVVLFALLGYAFHAKGSPSLATFFWAIGCALKWFPAFFIAAQELQAFRGGRKTQWIRSGLVFLGVTLALNAPLAIADYARHGSLEFWASPYLFHMRRPLYWDTLLGVGELWLGPLAFERFGSLWTLVLVGAALFAAPRMPVAEKGTLIIIAALFANRVYSAQFNLWFYPFLLLAAARAERPVARQLLVAFAAIDALNVFIYPLTFGPAFEEVGNFEPFAAARQGGPYTVLFSLAIVLRALALAALAAFLLRQEKRSARGPADPSGF